MASKALKKRAYRRLSMERRSEGEILPSVENSQGNNSHVVRVTTSGKMKRYIGFVLRQLQPGERKGVSSQERQPEDSCVQVSKRQKIAPNNATTAAPTSNEKLSSTTVQLVADGKAMTSAVSIAEIVKRRLGEQKIEVHQDTRIQNVILIETLEKVDKNQSADSQDTTAHADTLVKEKKVASMTITLSTSQA